MKFVQVLAILLIIVALGSIVLMNRRMNSDRNSLISAISKYEDEKERADKLQSDVNAAKQRADKLAGDVADREATISSLKEAGEEAGATISALEGSVSEANARVEELEGIVAEKDQAIQTMTSESEAKISELQSSVAEKDQTIESLQGSADGASVSADNSALATDLAELQAQGAEKDQTIEALQSAAAEKDASIAALQSAAAEKDASIETLQNEVAQKDASIETLQSASAEKDASIAALQSAAAEKDASIETLQNEAAQKDASIEALQSAAAEKDASIEALQSAAAEKDASLTDLENSSKQRISELEATVAQQGERIQELEKATPAPTVEPTPEPTAEPTPEPTAEPTPEPTPEPAFPLHLGSSNEYVTALQTKLAELGFQNLTADGSLGERTMTAVTSLQTAIGMEPTDTLNEEQFSRIMALQPEDRANLVWDGRFTNMAEYWRVYDQPQVCESVNGYLHLVGPGGVSQRVELEGGATYTLSLAANGDEMSEGMTFACQVSNEARQYTTPNYVLSQEPMLYSCTFTVDEAGAYDLSIASPNGGAAWYTDVKLEKGFVATEWTEHEGNLFAPIRVDSRGDDVLTLQAKLAEVGVLTGKLDGIFGGGTEKALMRLQQLLGMEENGAVSTSAEWERIMSLEAADGVNLIQNDSFAEASAHWGLWNQSGVCEIMDIDGTKWLHLNGTGGAKQTVGSLKAGQIYTLSVTVQGSDASVGLPFTCGIQQGDHVDWTPEFTLTGEPDRYVASFLAVQDGACDVLIGSGLNVPVEAWYTNIRLEKGVVK